MIPITTQLRHIYAPTAFSQKTRLAVLTLVVALATVGAAYADGIFSTSGTTPTIAYAPSTPAVGALLPSQATNEVSLDTSWGPDAVLWSVPSTRGLSCSVLQFVQTGASGSFVPNGPGACVDPGDAAIQASRDGANAINVAVDAYQTGSGWSVLVHGHLLPGNTISRLVIQEGQTALPVALNNGYYIGELPALPSADTLPASADGSAGLIAFDASGAQLGSADLAKLIQRQQETP